MKLGGTGPSLQARAVGKAPPTKPSQVCEHKAGKAGRLEERLFARVHFDPAPCHHPGPPRAGVGR